MNSIDTKNTEQPSTSHEPVVAEGQSASHEPIVAEDRTIPHESSTTAPKNEVATKTDPPSSEPQSQQKSPWQYALLSALVYPGAGQFARKQKNKAIIMGGFFSIFFILFGVLVCKGLLSLYGNWFFDANNMHDPELGVLCLKYSLIPAAVAGIIFIHSVYDAYKG